MSAAANTIDWDIRELKGKRMLGIIPNWDTEGPHWGQGASV